MATLSNSVFDAALNYIKSNCDKVQLVTSASAVLVEKASGITSADYTGPASGSSGGRKLSALTGSDFQSLSVSSAGSISKLRLLATSTVHVEASVASAPIAVGASDKVNIGSFKITLSDPA